jgi:hypothetical protein
LRGNNYVVGGTRPLVPSFAKGRHGVLSDIPDHGKAAAAISQRFITKQRDHRHLPKTLEQELRAHYQPVPARKLPQTFTARAEIERPFGDHRKVRNCGAYELFLLEVFQCHRSQGMHVLHPALSKLNYLLCDQSGRGIIDHLQPQLIADTFECR